MKRLLVPASALLTSTLLAPVVAYAVEEGPESPAAFNISVTTDYRYRGISQTRLDPALQGGYDKSFRNGIYIGTWASSIKWIKDAGTILRNNGVTPNDTGSANVEWDFYGGWKKELVKDLTLDLGGLYYYYPGNKLADVGAKNANTFELYGALSYGPVTAKYSHSLTNLFGTADSKGSGYLDVSATFDLGNGWSVLPHVGHQWIKNFSQGSYTDYSLIVGKDLGKGFNLSVGVYGTDADKNIYVSPENKFLGKSGLVGMLKFNF